MGMGILFTLSLLLSVGLCTESCLMHARGNPSHIQCSTSTHLYLPSFGSKLTRLKYLSSPIMYYNNSSSTFQLELLVSGDINPNPGPELSQITNSLLAIDKPTCRIVYAREELLRLNMRPHVTPESLLLPMGVIQYIQDMNLTRTQIGPQRHCHRVHRGKKGGKRRQKNIPVVAADHRPLLCPDVRQSSLNIKNLRQVKLGASPCLKAALWNARSIRNKTVSVHDFVLENELDILFITESWLGRDDSVIIGELTPPMYSFINVPRPNSTTYGGIGILFKSCLKLQLRSTDKQAVTFEHAVVMDISRCVQYVIIYRPPPSSKNGYTTTEFLYEFESFVSDVNLAANKIVIIGDFNLHIDLPSKPEIVSFMSILSSFDLFQHVSEATHVHGHILDLLIFREGGDIIHNCGVRKCLESDHYVVEFEISKERPAKQSIVSTTRKYRTIDMDSFKTDLINEFSNLEINATSNVNTVYDKFEEIILKVINSHAPPITRVRTTRPLSPWYNDEIRDARRVRRRLERKWQKHNTDETRKAYKEQHIKVNKLIFSAKETFYKTKLATADSKTMFRILNSLLNKGGKVLPVCDDYEKLSNSFADFFEDKISKLRQSLDGLNLEVNTHTQGNFDNPLDGNAAVMTDFRPVSEEDVNRIISKLPNKSCSLDVIPTWLLKQCISPILPPLTAIINLSLISGKFPVSLKQAIVTPIVKKASLDLNQLKNYRPVFNLKSFSKIMKKYAMSQLHKHMSDNELLDPYQSAYKPQHGTETALLKVQNDILCALGN